MLVKAAQQHHGRPRHGLDGADGAGRIGALAVVDVGNAVQLAHKLDAVLNAGERFERFADRLGRYAHRKREQRGEHGVLQIVPAGDADFGCADERQIDAVSAVDHHAVPHEHALRHLAAAGEVQAGRGRERVHGAHLGVVVVEHGEILGRLVLKHLALGGDVVVHRAEVIEMVGRDVAAGGRARMECGAALELQRRRFGHDHIAGNGLLRVLGDGDADVAEHERAEPARLEQLAGQRGAGGLTVGAGDADEIRLGVPVSQLDFGQHLDAQLPRAHDEGRAHGDDRAGDQHLHAVQQRHRILPEPVFHRKAAQRLIQSVDVRLLIVDDHAAAVSAEQLGRADAALCHADDQSRLFLFHSCFRFAMRSLLSVRKMDCGQGGAAHPACGSGRRADGRQRRARGTAHGAPLQNTRMGDAAERPRQPPENDRNCVAPERQRR